MKNIFYIGALLMPLFAISQVGIGTSNPEHGSVLDVESSTKGVLIPRIQLTGLTDLTTVQLNSQDMGLVIYNLEEAGQTPNNVYKDTFYIWTGTKWEDISNLDYSRQVITTNNVSSTLFIGNPAEAVTSNAANNYTTWTSVNFSNESLDTKNIHDAGVFTIPEDGLYSFAGGLNIERSDGSGTRKYFGGRIILNDVQVATSMFGTSAGGNNGFIPLYWNAMLKAGDKVQIQYRIRDSTSAGTFTLNVASNISIIKNSN